MNKKARLENLNILRGFSAFAIVMYHIRKNVGCDFGIFNWLFSYSTPWMTCFFVLSGFTLFYNYCDTDFDLNNIKKFVKKRALGIYPTYALMWFCFYWYYFNQVPAKSDILTFPLQLLLLQCIDYYDFFINSGTWFFSCIFICYLLFPYLCSIFRRLDNRLLLIFLIVAYIINTVLPFSYDPCNIDVYHSAFCRILEFSCGICTAAFFLRKQSDTKSFTLVISLTVFFSAIFIADRTDVILMSSYQDRMNAFTLPLVCVLVYQLSSCRNRQVHLAATCKITKFFSNLSMGCYAGSLFAQTIYSELINKHALIYGHRNLIAITAVFVLNLIFAYAIDNYAKYAKKFINRHGFYKIFIAFAILMIISIGIKTAIQGI